MKMDAPTHSFYENETLPATADYSEKLFVCRLHKFIYEWFIAPKSKTEVKGQSPQFREKSQYFC